MPGDKRLSSVREYFLLNFNPIIRWLIISDVIFLGSTGLLAPIFSVFVTDFVPGGNLQVAGIAATIFLVTKSIGQIPAAAIVDKIRGERDDYLVLIIGSLITALIPLLYIGVDSVGTLFIVQFINGLATAFTFPSYMAIFTRHIDKHKEGTEWGVYFTLTDLSTAGASAIGGSIAYYIGFNWVFIGVTILGITGTMALFGIRAISKKT